MQNIHDLSRNSGNRERRHVLILCIAPTPLSLQMEDTFFQMREHIPWFLYKVAWILWICSAKGGAYPLLSGIVL